MAGRGDGKRRKGAQRCAGGTLLIVNTFPHLFTHLFTLLQAGPPPSVQGGSGYLTLVIVNTFQRVLTPVHTDAGWSPPSTQGGSVNLTLFMVNTCSYLFTPSCRLDRPRFFKEATRILRPGWHGQRCGVRGRGILNKAWGRVQVWGRGKGVGHGQRCGASGRRATCQRCGAGAKVCDNGEGVGHGRRCCHDLRRERAASLLVPPLTTPHTSPTPVQAACWQP